MDELRTLNKKRILALVAALAVLMAALCLFSRVCGYDPAGSNAYNTYTLQALAWRDGQVHLPHDYPHLELAIFEENYYVSFPPVPSVPMWMLSFAFGQNTPDNLVVKLYALGAFAAVYWAVSRKGRIGAGLFWATFFVVASSFLPLMLLGAVWYQAQLLAFLLTVLAVVLANRGKATWSLALYALAVGCRPFNAIAGLAVAALLLHRKVPLKKWIPGVCAGLCIGMCYGLYNLARFGNFFEFGHNYLPEFTRSENGQFSLAYLWNNIKLVFAGKPFSNGEFVKFGFNMFMANPVFILFGVWIIVDVVKRKMKPAQIAAVIAFFVQLFLLMLHKSFGGFQMGLRYTADLIPCVLAYFLVSGRNRRVHTWEAVLLGAAMVFLVWGTWCVHI